MPNHLLLLQHTACTVAISYHPFFQSNNIPNSNCDCRSQAVVQVSKQLTLAQRLCLVPRPAAPLDAQQWQQVHQQARLRQHSDQECPICFEDFKSEPQVGTACIPTLQPSMHMHAHAYKQASMCTAPTHLTTLLPALCYLPQVLLSCAHVFHRQCLASFERYCATKVCPICRAQHYQKRAITDAADAFRHTCATRCGAAPAAALAAMPAAACTRHCHLCHACCSTLDLTSISPCTP